MPHDVFLSYNSQDYSAVEEIALKLHERGLSCFFDRWYLPKGQPWRSLLEQNLATVRSVIVFIGPNGMGPWQHREVDVALDMQARMAAFPVIPVLLPGSEPPLGFLRQNTWIDRKNQPLDQVVLYLEKSIRGEPPGPDLTAQFAATKNLICPYRGLLYFREEDALFFFGRDAAINSLQKAVEKSPFVAVVGASGSGKSSVARAGLVPCLRKDRQTVWEIASLVPGDEPLKALAAAIVPFLYPELDPIDRRAKANNLATHFADGSISLRDMVREVLDRQTGTKRILLIADQWEELYTLTTDDTQRRRFVDELLDASSRTPLSVVLTLRGDFVGSALAYRPLSDRLQGAQVNLGPMTAEELHLAICHPAREVGLQFQDGLAERILADVGHEPGHLPLLEFVLRELWENRQAGELLHEAYDSMGGLHGAVAAKADALYENLSAPEQEAARRLFLRLVHPADEGNNTRRRELLREIPESSRDLVARMADERLLVTSGSSESGDESVEVAHEALIRNWKQLTGWLNADREFLLWRERLRAMLEEWKRGGHNNELLLRGPVLGEAEGWLDRHGELMVKEERQFIQGSVMEQKKRQAEQEERLREEKEARRKAENARQEAEEASRRTKKWVWRTIGFAVMMLGVAGLALYQWSKARDNAKAWKLALAENYYRAIGTNDGPLGSAEIDGLWSLATLPEKDEDIRIGYLEHVFKGVSANDNEGIIRFSRRREQAIRAIAGLDPELRLKCHSLASEILLSEKPDAEQVTYGLWFIRKIGELRKKSKDVIVKMFDKYPGKNSFIPWEILAFESLHYRDLFDEKEVEKIMGVLGNLAANQNGPREEPMKGGLAQAAVFLAERTKTPKRDELLTQFQTMLGKDNFETLRQHVASGALSLPDSNTSIDGQVPGWISGPKRPTATETELTSAVENHVKGAEPEFSKEKFAAMPNDERFELGVRRTIWLTGLKFGVVNGIVNGENGDAGFQAKLKELVGKLNASDLLEILKTPFCVGKAEDVVLNELRIRLKDKGIEVDSKRGVGGLIDAIVRFNRNAREGETFNLRNPPDRVARYRRLAIQSEESKSSGQ